MTTDVKYSGSRSPACRPVEAMINATSPLDTMPAPTANDDKLLKPVILAPRAPPSNLVRTAAMVNTTMKPTC